MRDQCVTARQLCEPLEADNCESEVKSAAWSWTFLQPVKIVGTDTGRQRQVSPGWVFDMSKGIRWK